MQVLEIMKQREPALTVILRWLKLRPDDHKARVEAIRILQELERDDEALALARDGVRRNSRSGDARVVLATVLDDGGDRRGALREMRAAERLFQDPINRGYVRTLKGLKLSTTPDSIRALATADSLAEEARLRDAMERR
jgi:tetratricopeptide (TPR) repeat protein